MVLHSEFSFLTYNVKWLIWYLSLNNIGSTAYLPVPRLLPSLVQSPSKVRDREDMLSQQIHFETLPSSKGRCWHFYPQESTHTSHQILGSRWLHINNYSVGNRRQNFKRCSWSPCTFPKHRIEKSLIMEIMHSRKVCIIPGIVPQLLATVEAARGK